MKTFLYIDGFNLYYSSLKNTPLRWLNPLALVARVFPRNSIAAMKYFTARVEARPTDPDQPNRQALYWRALRTLPCCEIIEGHFRVRQVQAALVNPPPPFVRVFKTEEKGSDVNLASHLLMDGFLGHYECAIVISGDSDLITPIRMVKEVFKKPVGVLNPQRLSGPDKRPLRQKAGLPQAAAFYKDGVTWNQLLQSQFPDTLTDDKGTFYRPPSWTDS